ncbi:helix-turn-helix domain-containing protein [Ochrobactrum soli]|uniref:Chromosomal replication initiator DnaA C-terminal domain-containing protein n=1 Tax=Ochrobactrum soli TaxID=2448455 RepID=A0A849KUF4_9HYPH|nr:helix-turn-helix domain-containing protein [[Ochrobactrum] soli]NNU62449.1 hypothetical protein [[Ochrobactrum] soli]
MFAASYRRTESNPRTAAAIRAQRLREQEARQQSGAVTTPPRMEAKPVAVVKPAPVLSIGNSVAAPVDDCVIAQNVQRKWSQFLQALTNVVLPVESDVYRADFQKIVSRICRVFGVAPRDVVSSSCRHDLIMPRQAIYYWAYRLTPLSCQGIGAKLGNRDHSTVLYGVKAYRKKRAGNGRHLRAGRRKP